jgi:hypothetical protein
MCILCLSSEVYTLCLSSELCTLCLSSEVCTLCLSSPFVSSNCLLFFLNYLMYIP